MRARVRVPHVLVPVTTAALLAAVAAVAGPPAPAGASTIVHKSVVSANPSDHTPDLLDGTAWDVARLGPDRYVVVGSFDAVSEPASDAELRLTSFVEFDSATGHVLDDVAPDVNGEIRAVWPSADGRSVFVGGSFTSVNGERADRLAKIDADTGELDPDFHPPSIDGPVRDLTVVGGRLVVAGKFRTVGGDAHPALVALDPGTGARLSFFDGITVAGTHVGRGGTEIFDLDTTPDGSRLVAVGNVGTVDGEPRDQAFQLDTGGSKATLVGWRLPQYGADCHAAFDAPIRNVAIAPGGAYAVIVASGGKAGICDAAARFELRSRGDVKASWVNYTGGDTLQAVEITGAAVYVGGHQRWLNNPRGRDSAGPGAVERPGIAALSTTDGTALSWNPGKSRGVGVRVIHAEKSGIWVGSDTCSIGGETHCRIAAFPLPD